MCGHFKMIVYGAAVNEAELQQRVKDGCELIRNTPGIFLRVLQSSMRRAARYLEEQG
jgi:hypothetical protein